MDEEVEVPFIVDSGSGMTVIVDVRDMVLSDRSGESLAVVDNGGGITVIVDVRYDVLNDEVRESLAIDEDLTGEGGRVLDRGALIKDRMEVRLANVEVRMTGD